MKETAQQITDYLNQFNPEEIKFLYTIVSRVLLSNPDFNLAADNAEEDKIGPVIADLTGRKIPFEYETILSEEDRKIFCELRDLAKQKRITRPRRIRLLSQILSNDTLFEGFCCAFFLSDDDLDIFSCRCGCPRRLQELQEDPVFQSRRGYLLKISDCAHAAVNLYGVIDVKEFMALLQRMEQSLLSRHEGYNRSKGAYRSTVAFSPEWFCKYTVGQLVRNCTAGICMSLDGLILHPCFYEEVKAETERFISFCREKGNAPGEEEIRDFFAKAASDTRFRLLYSLASGCSRYLPSKTEFLKYTDAEYYEMSAPEHRLQSLLYGRLHLDPIKPAGEKYDPLAETVDSFMREYHQLFSDAGRMDADNANQAEDNAFDLAEQFNISFTTEDDIAEFREIVRETADATRLWVNCGHTNDEMAQMYIEEEGDDPCPEAPEKV